MDRQADQAAFAKACAYLNYKKGAKWTAHAAAAGTGVVYVALLVVLWLFTDLLVYRGQLPTFHTLTPLQQRECARYRRASKTSRNSRLSGYETYPAFGRVASRKRGFIQRGGTERSANDLVRPGAAHSVLTARRRGSAGA